MKSTARVPPFPRLPRVRSRPVSRRFARSRRRRREAGEREEASIDPARAAAGRRTGVKNAHDERSRGRAAIYRTRAPIVRLERNPRPPFPAPRVSDRFPVFLIPRINASNARGSCKIRANVRRLTFGASTKCELERQRTGRPFRTLSSFAGKEISLATLESAILYSWRESRSTRKPRHRRPPSAQGGPRLHFD